MRGKFVSKFIERLIQLRIVSKVCGELELHCQCLPNLYIEGNHSLPLYRCTFLVLYIGIQK